MVKITLHCKHPLASHNKILFFFHSHLSFTPQEIHSNSFLFSTLLSKNLVIMGSYFKNKQKKNKHSPLLGNILHCNKT